MASKRAAKPRGYEQYLQDKFPVTPPAGFEPGPLPEKLFHYQHDMVQWACRRGRAALFADTGLGKSFCQLSWADQVVKHTGRHVLVLCPLAVAAQTIEEGRKLGVTATRIREAADVPSEPGVVVCNYDMLHALDTSIFAGVVLDESSCIKSFSGITKRQIFEAFKGTQYKLCCTATPAPNDHMELGQHCEFLGVLSSHEMLTRYFINDTSQFGTYRLKKHSVDLFWDWVCQWARCVGKPSDLGYSDDGFILPELTFNKHSISVDVSSGADDGHLFRMPEMSATSIHKEKRATVEARAEGVAALVRAEPEESWIVWCDTDYEADALTRLIPEATEIRGSDSIKAKEAAVAGFASGEIRVLISKSSIFGFGLNWQHCARVAFVGATYSYEQFYQAIRRCWRFGQRRPVQAHMMVAVTEDDIWTVLQRKAAEHESMKSNMFAAARRAQLASTHTTVQYNPTHKARLPAWIRATA